MTSISILINTIDKVKQFVQLVSGFEGDLDLSTGRYTIDAKSIMGIFSLDISKPLDLTIYNDEKAAEYIEQLHDFIIESTSKED